MRRSICYCEPNAALAGEIATWKFSYTTATSLPKGNTPQVDLLSRGREIDWELPSTSIKDKKNSSGPNCPTQKSLPPKK